MKKYTLFFLSFLIILAFSSCSKEDLSTSSNTSTTTSRTPLLDLVNTYRREGCTCGTTYMPPVSPLTWSDKLAQAAKIHSDDMNQNNFFNHIGSDGSDMSTRVQRVGFSASMLGENIASGVTSEQQVMDMWMGSTGHCKNIMNADFKYFGAHLSGTYWTQVFAK